MDVVEGDSRKLTLIFLVGCLLEQYFRWKFAKRLLKHLEEAKMLSHPPTDLTEFAKKPPKTRNYSILVGGEEVGPVCLCVWVWGGYVCVCV